MGRTKSAEEELSGYSDNMPRHLENALAKLQNTANTNANPSKPDDFQYYLEYNGVRAKIDEKTALPSELHELFDKLKENLHY